MGILNVLKKYPNKVIQVRNWIIQNDIYNNEIIIQQFYDIFDDK